MKTYIALVLAFAVLNAAPSEAFIGSLINSVVTAVVDTVTTVVDTVTTVVDTVVYVGNFLWENTVDPTIQVIVENGTDFIDTYFGWILNGKRDIAELEMVETQKKLFKQLYLAETKALTENIKKEFLGIFIELGEQLKTAKNLPVKLALVELMKKAQIKIKVLAMESAERFNNKTKFAGAQGLTQFIQTTFNAIANQVNNLLNGYIAELTSVLLG